MISIGPMTVTVWSWKFLCSQELALLMWLVVASRAGIRIVLLINRKRENRHVGFVSLIRGRQRARAGYNKVFSFFFFLFFRLSVFWNLGWEGKRKWVMDEKIKRVAYGHVNSFIFKHKSKGCRKVIPADVSWHLNGICFLLAHELYTDFDISITCWTLPFLKIWQHYY